MLSKCLNPSCRAPFQYMDEGRIFHVERRVATAESADPQRVVEYFWLCGPCSQRLKVIVENGTITTEPACTGMIAQNLCTPEVVRMN